MGWREKSVDLGILTVLLLVASAVNKTAAYGGEDGGRSGGGGNQNQRHRNAYAAMMYMGTPRDYEYYVALRVMMRSLAKLKVEADLLVIASADVPLRWVQSLEQEDGAKVVTVENLNNPYKNQDNFDKRFKLTLNKLYAWSLVEYERVIMLDSDNLFLQKTDELFECGQFCAVFINPCIFHTGLFVLQPSMEVFRNMLHELEIGRQNPDGADQGFLASYFSHLLDQPMFHPPPPNATKLHGNYRLPLGYQMDASYYYLKLRWSIPCGPNSVITFPSAPWLKPWYWWSWPVLPLGLKWHQQRLQTLGYNSEMPVVLMQCIAYLGLIAITRLARPNISKFCYRRLEKTSPSTQTGLKILATWLVLAAYILPSLLIPRTVHPLLGWSLYLLGCFAISSVAVTVLLLPFLAVVTPGIGILGALLVMAFPWYPDGVVRALAVFAYAFCCAPIAWNSVVKIMTCFQVSHEKEVFFQRVGDCQASSTDQSIKLC